MTHIEGGGKWVFNKQNSMEKMELLWSAGEETSVSIRHGLKSGEPLWTRRMSSVSQTKSPSYWDGKLQ